jgi:hypothetical protein
MDEDVVASQTAEVIDLKTYRERKAEERPAAADGFIARDLHFAQAFLAPFSMPVAFFVFWPTWILAPQFAQVSDKGGSDAA